MEQLACAVVKGEAGAWLALQQAILPLVVGILRTHRSMRRRGLHLIADDVQEVTTATLERLSRADYRNLRRYVEQLERAAQTVQSFDSWLYGAVDYAIRDHLRLRYGRAPKRSEDDERAPCPSKRDVNTNASGLSDLIEQKQLAQTMGITKNITAAEIFAYALHHFAGHELQALHLHYVEDCDFDVIARALSLPDANEAQKLIRRLNARLRHRFDRGAA